MKRHIQFSKIITAAFSTVMLPMSAYVVWKCLEIASLAVSQGFMGALPYVTAIIGFVEGTIATVYALYHSNSKTEKKCQAKNYVTVAAPEEDSVQGAQEVQEVNENRAETHEPMQSINLNIDF